MNICIFMLKTKEQYAFFECILLKFIHFFFIQTPRHTTAYTSIGSAADKTSCAKIDPLLFSQGSRRRRTAMPHTPASRDGARAIAHTAVR